MKHIITIITITTITLLSGCVLDFGWGDPCETNEQGEHTNPAWNGLSASQQAACDACGLVDCSDVETETGDDSLGSLVCTDARINGRSSSA